MAAILFGSISTVADTSELQRRSFNEAFKAHNLDWDWSREDYRATLGTNGGAKRIAEYAKSVDQDVDAKAVHATKSEIFQKLIGSEGVQPRPGVVESLAEAKANGLKTALVTTTLPENVTALLDALDDVSFDVVVDLSKVQESKPDPASYLYALDQLGEDASSSVAIEDNEGGVAAASAASVKVVAFPNSNTKGGDFSAAVETVDSLDPSHLRQLTTS
jgi:HAD superfamily hydrolase (TIGR01509 family)